jgi:hypothetical protein
MDDERVRDGIDHLQRAAKEMIDAARAFLDVADRVVDDPASATSLADLLGRVAKGTRRPRHDGDDSGPAVERIDIS